MKKPEKKGTRYMEVDICEGDAYKSQNVHSTVITESDLRDCGRRLCGIPSLCILETTVAGGDI